MYGGKFHDGVARGPRLFRFAVLADTHMNERDDVSSSPWLTNRLANRRALAAVHAINRFAPAFTVHLGDMVHPVPAQDSYGAAAERALATFAELGQPVHYVPGNHDIGDKPLTWMPAEVVNDSFIETYGRYFGSDYYTFEHGDCCFIVLNAQILNSGMDREESQWGWLEKALADARGKRLFVFSHYPLYIATPDEAEHYDNLGTPARQRLLALFEQYGVEACLSAHVHNFFFDRRHGTDLYVLPAVSAIRHDYSELFRVPPADSEHGRDDNAKLGFFVIDVQTHGHVAHYVRSYGATDAAPAGDDQAAIPFAPPHTHSRLGLNCPVGVDMRQAWAQAVQITPSGAVDEFYRKRARNDYVLSALWEMGITKLRVPLDDLTEKEARRRLAVLQEIGHEILLYSYDVPSGDIADLIADSAKLLSALEIIVPTAQAPDAIAAIADLGTRTGVLMYLSRLRSSAEAKAAGARYTHFITHGFGPGDESLTAELMQQPGAAEALEGLVFRVTANEDPGKRIAAVSAHVRDLGARAVIHLTLADENPAKFANDEAVMAERVTSALRAASAHRDVCTVYLDTLADIDRGYFPRLGLVDRRFNPRATGRVFSSLQSELVGLE